MHVTVMSRAAQSTTRTSTILFLTTCISFPYGGKPSLKRKANAFYSNTTTNLYSLNETEYTHEEPPSALNSWQIQTKSPCTLTTAIKSNDCIWDIAGKSQNNKVHYIEINCIAQYLYYKVIIIYNNI